jgi:DNA polymerase III delta subunit
MLYTLYGTDIEKNRARSRALTAGLQEKRPDASLYRLHLENWSRDMFAELTQSIGLFSTKYIIVLDNLLTGSSEKKYEEGEEPVQMILEALPTLKRSDHIWIIVEDALFGKSTGKELGVKESKLLSEIESALKKHSDKIETHDARVKVTPASFGAKRNAGIGTNSFTFTDAFFDKNPVQALNALTALANQETAAEEIHGALWWQTKVLFQALRKDTKSLSPFVVSKCSRFLKKWSDAELKNLSNSMVEIYHQAHLGRLDLGGALAKLTLAI